jgi:hypothetical protein
MVQIIQARPQAPTIGQKLSGGVGRGLEMGSQMMQQYQQQQADQQKKQAIAQLLGQGSENLPPELQKLMYESMQKGEFEETDAARKFQYESELQRQKYGHENKAKADELAGKNQEKIAPLQNALESIKQMRNIRKKGNLGFGSAVKGIFGGDTAKHRGEYETLGNSLIQFATSIPIRNKVEFEKLAGRISDPSITDAEAEGILNSMEKIITDSLGVIQGGSQNQVPPHLSKQNRPPLTNWERK